MIGAGELLRKLGSGIRPDGLGSGSAAGAPAIEDRAFDDLLGRARRGELSSGRSLRTGPGVTADFDDATFEMLSTAADAAEAAGARRLLALVDDRAARIDVESREIRAVSARSSGEVLTGFDAAVVIGPAPNDTEGARGPAFVRNAALGEILARGVRGDAAAQGAPRRAG